MGVVNGGMGRVEHIRGGFGFMEESRIVSVRYEGNVVEDCATRDQH